MYIWNLKSKTNEQIKTKKDSEIQETTWCLPEGRQVKIQAKLCEGN